MAFSTGCQSKYNILMPSRAYTVYLYSSYATYTILALLKMAIKKDITLHGLCNLILGSKGIYFSSV